MADPFDFLRLDPRYRYIGPIDSGPTKAPPSDDLQRIYPRPPVAPGRGLDAANIGDVILHDYGGYANPRNFAPYHISVTPEGEILERYGSNERAPHAFGMNPHSWGVSYAGPVGSTPTPEAMSALQSVAGGLRASNPNLRFRGHGEAFQDTRGTPLQASRDGRMLAEASWRNQLFDQPQQPPSMSRFLMAEGQPPPAPQPQPPPVSPPVSPPTQSSTAQPNVGPWQTSVQPEPQSNAFGDALGKALANMPEMQPPMVNQTAMGLLSGPPPMPLPSSGWVSNPFQQRRPPGLQRFTSQFGTT
jgi:hypothetical protein